MNNVYPRLRHAHGNLDPRLASMLAEVPRLGPEHHWQGTLEGTHGASQGSVLRISAKLAFHGSLIEGEGRFTNAPSGDGPWHDRLAITGTECADAVTVQLWFAAQAFRPSPFLCAGQMSMDATEMRGDWSFACFNPDSCGCNGGGGTFELRCVD